MLKTPDSVLPLQQQQSQSYKHVKDPKNVGNSISLLKATSKVLAFLNPTGRKTHSAASIPDLDDNREPPLSGPPSSGPESGLYNNAAAVSSRRGPMHDDASTVEQYKHLFQNRPLNRQQQSAIRPDVVTHRRSGSSVSKKSNRSNKSSKRPYYTQLQSQPHPYQSHHARRQNKSATATSTASATQDDVYTETEIKLAKEQLRIVRRNLRECSPDSVYFCRFAPMADDWHSFLPRRNVREKEKIDDFCDAQSCSEIDSEGDYEYDCDNSEEDSEELDSPPLTSSRPLLKQPDTYTRRHQVTASSSSTSSFVKELLREEELCRIVSSATVDRMNGSSRDVSSLPLSRSAAAGFVSALDLDVDAEEASYADADDNTSPKAFSGGRINGSQLQRGIAKGAKTNRKLRQRASKESVKQQQQRKPEHRGSTNSINELLRSNARSKNGHRVHSNDIRRLDVTHSTNEKRRTQGRRRSSGGNGHHPVQLHPHQQSNQHRQNAHFGGMCLEDIVRGIETEFSLCLDDHSQDDDEAGESEDSLTCLVSGYENSGAEESVDDEGSARTSAPAASAGATRLGGSHSQFEATAAKEHDAPPKYTHHTQDQQLIDPTSMGLYSQQAIKSASTAALAQAMNTSAREEAVAEVIRTSHSKDGTSVRPSLTLQTLTHTMAGIAPGALSAFESRPLGSQYSLTKCNSTSSLYIDSTMAKSDVDETLRAVATVLYDKVLQSHRMNDCRTERIINSSSYVPSEKVIMAQADIFDFMRFIFDCGQNLGAENAIITLIYVERMTELGNLSFHAINWRRLLLGALILSIKVWEDLAVFNSDVCAIFEGLSVKDVNALERFSMAKLQYNVSVKRSLYAVYYFRLRDVSEQQHNLHYGKLTLSMSQRDMMMGSAGSSQTILMSRNDSCTSAHSSSIGSSRLGSSGGLMTMGIGLSSGISLTNGMGMGMGMAGSTSTTSTALSSTHHSKVPVGPGYRKWTLKPLSVREADRLEARSSFYTSTMMIEAQERKDAGCCLDKYSGTPTPEELQNLSATLLSASVAAGASMHTISSMTSVATAVGAKEGHNSSNDNKGLDSGKTMSASSSTSSTSTKVSGSVADLSASNMDESPRNEGTEPVRRVLRLRKSRSDFFFQNTTPASIM